MIVDVFRQLTHALLDLTVPVEDARAHAKSAVDGSFAAAATVLGDVASAARASLDVAKHVGTRAADTAVGPRLGGALDFVQDVTLGVLTGDVEAVLTEAAAVGGAGLAGGGIAHGATRGDFHIVEGLTMAHRIAGRPTGNPGRAAQLLRRSGAAAVGGGASGGVAAAQGEPASEAVQQGARWGLKLETAGASLGTAVGSSGPERSGATNPDNPTNPTNPTNPDNPDNPMDTTPQRRAPPWALVGASVDLAVSSVAAGQARGSSAERLRIGADAGRVAGTAASRGLDLVTQAPDEAATAEALVSGLEVQGTLRLAAAQEEAEQAARVARARPDLGLRLWARIAAHGADAARAELDAVSRLESAMTSDLSPEQEMVLRQRLAWLESLAVSR